MNLSKNNGFTASDIERYHSGKMSPAEMHALEKAALDDPFLADALEGYAFTSTPADDLSKIQSRLDEKLHRKRVVPFFQKYKWLSAAAIVLIIAGAGWLASIVSSQQKNSVSIAQKEEKPVNNSIPSAQTTSDSVITNKKSETTTDQQINRKEEEQKSIPTQTNNAVAKRSRQVIGDNKEAPRSNTETMPVVTNATNEHQLRELTVNKEALPKAQTDKIVNVQQGRTFYKNSNNTPARSANDTIKNLNIVLHPIPMDSADVVVVGYGSQKKSKSNYPKVTIDTLEPSEGYTNFDDYVANNLKMPEEFKDKPVSGEVQLSFDVDENGQPTNITVVKSLCQKCDEEAIRLLKEGPKWKKKKNKKGKITFKF